MFKERDVTMETPMALDVRLIAAVMQMDGYAQEEV